MKLNAYQNLVRILSDKLGPDLVLRSGNIICMDRGNTTAEAVAVKGKKIIAIGSNKEIDSLAGKNTEIIDLSGRAVLPGFIESHFHPDWYALSLLEVNLEKCASVDDVLESLKERIKQTEPGVWVKGYLIPSSLFPGKGELNRWKLDQISLKNPVFIQSLHHSCCVNSFALNVLEIDRNTPLREGWIIHKDANGEPTGVLEDNAWIEAQARIPHLPFSEHIRAFGLGMEKFLENGLTTIHDAIGDPEMIRMLQTLDHEDGLRLRVHVSPDIARFGDSYLNTGIHTAFGSEKLKFHQMKIILNTFSGATAALFEDYANDPGNQGYFLSPPEQVEKWVMNSVKSGWSVHTHVMGDRELDMVLTAYEKAIDWYKKETGKDNTSLRLAIAHYGLYNESLLKKTANLKIVVNTQPIFKLTKGKPGGIYEQRLGHERWLRSFPIRTLFDIGIAPCLSSDVPSAPTFDVRAGIYACLDGCGQPKEIVTPYQAIQGYTVNGAYALFREHEIGSVEIGKLADFVVLSENPLTLPKERIWDISTNRPKDLFIDYTVVGGKVEYRRA